MKRPIQILVALGLCLSGLMAQSAVVVEGHGYYAPGTPLPPESSDFVLDGRTWSSSTVTYSFMAGGISLAGDPGPPFHVPAATVSLGSFMPAGYQAEIRAAFDAWEDVAGLIFVEVSDDGVAFNASPTSGHGDIRIGGAPLDGPGSVLAHGFFPPPNGNSAAGDIHFDADDTWQFGFGGGGFDVFQVAAHEIGHAIGLRHTGTVDTDSLMDPFYATDILGPQADDIAGAQALYGASLAGVPEPSSLALIGIAALCLRGLRRRENGALPLADLLTPLSPRRTRRHSY